MNYFPVYLRLRILHFIYLHFSLQIIYFLFTCAFVAFTFSMHILHSLPWAEPWRSSLKTCLGNMAAACVFKHHQALPSSIFLLHSRFYRCILLAYLPPCQPAPPPPPAPLSPPLIYSSYPLPVFHPSWCPFASSCSLRPFPRQSSPV